MVQCLHFRILKFQLIFAGKSYGEPWCWHIYLYIETLKVAQFYVGKYTTRAAYGLWNSTGNLWKSVRDLGENLWKVHGTSVEIYGKP